MTIDEMVVKPDVAAIQGDFVGKSIVSVGQFALSDVAIVMEQTAEMALMVHRHGRSNLLHDKIVANLFYEPSTRTFMSFEAAAKRLGADTIATQGVEYSSISKGETLEDTIRSVERYADVIDIRHSQIGAAATASSVARVPILNGGDGTGEHPTQALLDLFTIREEAIAPPEDLTVTLLGDLKNGRTVHSLARLLAKYNTQLQLVAPPALFLPEGLRAELGDLVVAETDDLDDVLGNSDVLYVTRVQKERFDKTPEGEAEYNSLKDKYTITPETMERANPTMILMHPLPRVNEIHRAVDKDPRAKYFEQVENGMYVRMALLALVMNRATI
jgi:aspartate carbamoyltransferase catalytic subunit